MNLLKKILIHILIIIIILMSCFSIYFANKHGLNIYAETETTQLPSGYSPVTDDMELAQSFNDYCKSRDAYFTSTDMGATYTYIYNYMKEGLGYLGYNIDELQEGLYKQVEDNTIARWYMNSTLMGAYNELFAYLINENDLAIGDEVDKTIYSGEYFIDDDGHSCLVTITNRTISSETEIYSSNIIAKGSSFIKSGGANAVHWYESNGNGTYISFKYQNRTYDYPIKLVNLYGIKKYTCQTNTSNPNQSTCYRYIDSDNNIVDGYPTIFKGTTNYYGYGVVTNNNNGWVINSFYKSDGLSQVNIIFTSNNMTINNNVYEGDTIINNEGDIINENPTPGYNPYPDGGGPTTPSTGIGDGNGTQLTLPDLDFNLPSINWSIGDLTEKFPFSIPFDLIAFLTILNAEPETPEIQGNLNLAIINWEFDYDLHQFDDLASLLRNLEFIGFCIGLVLITRSLLR